MEELPFSFSDQPIVGHRLWKLQKAYDYEGKAAWRLRSWGVNVLWSPGERNSAMCLANTKSPRSSSEGAESWHDSPGRHCRCGIWAFKSYYDERLQMEKGKVALYVSGEIFLWGNVIETSGGYRGKFAYPKTLTIVSSGFLSHEKSVKIAKEISENYKIPTRLGNRIYGLPEVTQEEIGIVKKPGYIDREVKKLGESLRRFTRYPES